MSQSDSKHGAARNFKFIDSKTSNDSFSLQDGENEKMNSRRLSNDGNTHGSAEVNQGTFEKSN